MTAKYVLLYESAPDVAEKAPLHYAAHAERLQQFASDGTLLLVGPFADPQEHGSMAVFTSREAAEDFVADDPFRVNGVVVGWEVREWHEVLAA